jgi:transcriptional regulator with GAF, ATPase, and Fis domain
MIGESPAMIALRHAIERVAPTDATVLILGETGVGKELVARTLHEKSLRAKRAFVAVSCVSLAASLLAAELFGHEAGAFTGAVKRRLGRFEQADGGTLFLDEIGEMSSESQAMLLRALQERVIERVGGDSVAVDIRVIAATNRNLSTEVTAGRFRLDLFHRLNIFPITVPPLRERTSDLPALTEAFVNEFARKYNRGDVVIPPHILRQIATHDWPGNIRELRNLIERAVIMTDGSELAFDAAWLVGGGVAETAKTWAAQEKQRILDALRAADGRIYGPGGAAHRLGLNPTTLYGKMRKHGITRNGADWS